MRYNGNIKSETVTITTGQSESSVFQIGGSDIVYFKVPTWGDTCAAATTSMYVQVGQTSTTSTMARVKAMGVYSAGSGILDWQAPDHTGPANIVCGNLAGYSHGMIEITTATTNATEIIVYTVS